MANSVGQPTKMTEATLKLLDECFANGATDIQACFIANISTQTLYNYQHEHPEYVERKQALKDMVAYQAKLNIKNSLMADDEKLKIETSKWYLDRRDKEFKPKSEQDLTSLGNEIKGINYILPNGDNDKTDTEATSSISGSSE